jgi:acyl-CoA ligase (AMP-forming) (exosortase A-associated)
MEYLLHHLLRTATLRWPDKEALAHGDERVSYRRFHQWAAALAAGLREAGTNRGERVGVFLEKGLPEVVSIFGISQAGAVWVPINAQLRPEQLQYIATHCGIVGLIVSASKMKALSSVLSRIATIRYIVVVGNEEDNPVAQAFPTRHRFERLIQSERCSPTEDVCVSKDLAAILYTSGSTGKPKGVMLSHANILAGARIVADYLELQSSDRILSVLPFSFDAGLNQLTTSVLIGASCVLSRFLFARDIIRIIGHEHITGVAGVPTFWTMLMQGNAGKQYDLSSLRYITNTGGCMPLSVLAELRTKLPDTRIFLMYGLTEAFRSTYLPPDQLDRRPESIGKAIPDTEIFVINDQGRLCAPGEVGQLVHRGPTVALGYWNDIPATQDRFRKNPLAASSAATEERVCYSGDLVRQDEDGFLYYVGRGDSMIKSSGHRISPTEIEEVLFSSGYVRHAAVVGVADERMGHTIVAFVTPLEGSQQAEQQILQYCVESLPRYMVPAKIELVESLPTTSSGKVDYCALRQRLSANETGQSDSAELLRRV